MDGKLLILCGERPTVDEFGDRLDKNGHILKERNGKFFGADNKPVEVDTHKDVLSALKLLGDQGTEFIFTHDMLFVDWETVIDSTPDILQQMKQYAMGNEVIPFQFMQKVGKNETLMRRAHWERLFQLDDAKCRPSIDYGFQAMDDFMQLFSRTIAKLGVVSILPALPNKDDEDVNMARWRVMNTWDGKNQMESQMGIEARIHVLPPMRYDEFGEVYQQAQHEMMKIISAPYWFEQKSDGKESEGR